MRADAVICMPPRRGAAGLEAAAGIILAVCGGPFRGGRGRGANPHFARREKRNGHDRPGTEGRDGTRKTPERIKRGKTERGNIRDDGG